MNNWSAKEAASKYLKLGLAPIPIPLRSKKPATEGWLELRR